MIAQPSNKISMARLGSDSTDPDSSEVINRIFEEGKSHAWIMQQLGPPIGSFKSINHQAIKEGLSNVIGSSGAVAVIINFHLDVYEDDPFAFHKALTSVFRLQAEILEKSIVKELYSKMGERFETSSVFDFATHMDFLKQLFRAKVVQS